MFLSGTAKDLLQKLLQKHPGERLGVNGGIDEILSHEYFKKIDFKELENKRIKPPLKPDPLKFNIDENESKKGE